MAEWKQYSYACEKKISRNKFLRVARGSRGWNWVVLVEGTIINEGYGLSSKEEAQKEAEKHE